MRIPITDLVDRPGATREVTATLTRGEVDAPASDWGPADEALDGPIGVDLRLEMLVDGLLVRGRLAFATSLPCGRCLTDVDADHNVAVSELYIDPRRLDPDAEEVEAGYEILPEGAIDLVAMFRDSIVATIPLRALCHADCRGLCPVCGADRNVSGCGHGETEAVDPRWAPLQDLSLPPG
ncbi:MAG: DUF177 domain-containing protein [Actinomycetota bacterium]|nr:DUF177 domain-containing protein [Actinomycetota bacterium]